LQQKCIEKLNSRKTVVRFDYFGYTALLIVSLLDGWIAR